VQDALEPVRSRLDARSMAEQEVSLLPRVVRRQELTDRLQWDFEVPEPDDPSRPLELLVLVQPVPGFRVDAGRSEQVELVVMTQRADAQPVIRANRPIVSRSSMPPS